MYDVIIVGAGPAGLTAALYAGRYRLNTLILEKVSAGGQIIYSPVIENFPGFPGGIATDELIKRFTDQVDELGVIMETQEVIDLDFNCKTNSSVYVVKTKERLYETKSIIIASGAYPKRLETEGEERFTGKGVSYCGTCDAPLFRNKDVIVVGGGDRAIEEAIYLSEYAVRVRVIHRRQDFRASGILMEKIKKNPKVEFMLNSVVEEIKGINRVEAVMVRNVKDNILTELKCDGVFIFVGIKPNTGFLKNHLEKDASGFIITEQDMQTSRIGVFACGDCRKKKLYQVVNACGEGAVAADSVHKYLLTYA